MKKETISKSLFLKAAVCPTLGWQIRSGEYEGEEPTLAQEFRMEQGADIGRRASKIFHGGVLISERNLAKAAAQTTTLIRAGGPSTLFEATFVADEYAARADVLVRSQKGWHLIEVKSSVNPKPELIADLAYTLMVLNRAGLKVAKASLLLISKDFRIGMEDSKLFVEYDCTREVVVPMVQFQPYWDIVRKQTSAATMPEPRLISACKKCSLFSDCMGRGIENHVFEIPRLSAKKLDALTNIGAFQIEEIPEDFELTAIQDRIRRSVVTGQPWVGPELKNRLNAIKWPAHYLDFETMMTAVPLYPDMAPYTQVPTQYSIHKCTDVGKIDSHAEYLADPKRDSRRELAKSLVADLKGDGSIVTYSTFEKTTISALGALFPDLASDFDRIKERIYDLEAVIRDNYYHPDFHGSNSIKSTLPALLPEMSYDSLNVRDGDSASAAFALMAMGRYDKAKMAQVSKDLLAYCGQDTLAMVKLHERLHQV